jgi:hypothetical protein
MSPPYASPVSITVGLLFIIPVLEVYAVRTGCRALTEKLDLDVLLLLLLFLLLFVSSSEMFFSSLLSLFVFLA